MPEKKTPKNEVFNDWVNKYSKPLLNRAMYLVSNKNEAEDIVQEVYISAFNSYENFQEKSKPLTWLMAILNNKVSDFYRKKYKKEPQLNIDNFFDGYGNWKNKDVLNQWNDTVENNHLLDDSEFNKAWHKCIENLPQKWKMLIKLYYLEEKKASEVSQELQITTTNIWKILQRSRLQLRECLETNWFSIK